ncbi:hypothetical protein [uncultured Spirosoma sp.]|nr:hypothetical protein [uncultured Spirosoma sp.]
MVTVVRSASEWEQYYFTPDGLSNSVEAIIAPTMGATGSECNAHIDQ